MQHRRTMAALAAVAASAAVAATAAVAHQTAFDRGVSVTMHVSPDDEPVAGRASAVTITRVRVPKKGRFTFRGCGCRLKVVDADGRTVAGRRMRNRTSVTFPAAGAYRLTYSGHFRRSGRTRHFSTSFTVRAFAG